MDNLENASSPQAELGELRGEFESLRQLVTSLLVLLLVISGTLNYYFWRQFRIDQGELAVERAQIAQMVQEFNKGQAIAISNFVGKLVDFEKKNPDFSPILAKYGVRPAAATGAPPTTATAPAQTKK
jgi:hypothetical protein